MHPWTEIADRVVAVLGIASEVVALALIPSVLLRRKEPASTIAWILALAFLPALGAFLFLLFGRDRVRIPAKKKRAIDAAVREQLDAREGGAGGLAVEGASDLELALFRIADRLTHARPRSGNTVEVLSDGAAAFDALGAAIDAAKHHVHAEYYLIRDDPTGRWFRDRLAAAAARGVKVRLLCDAFGCFALSPRWERPLRRAGGEVARFLPMRSIFLQPINLRNHRKIVVVDGQVAFTGGFNVAEEYRGEMPGIGHWRDVHLRVEGPAAHELDRVFFQDWAYASRRAIDASEFRTERAAEAGPATVAVVPSGPDSRGEAIHRLFVAAIGGARARVRITTPYFVPDQALTVALTLAAMRGVDVQLLLPSRSNHRVTFHAGRSFYETLLDAGVRILELEGGIVHAKTLVVDEAVCLVGSANMDMRSFRLNFEIHALVHDAATARALGAVFEEHAAKSRVVDLATWRERPRLLHFYEGAARLVSPLL